MSDEGLQGTGEHRTILIDRENMTEETRTVQCALGICPDHPHTVERVAMLEQALKDMKGQNNGIIVRLDKIRDATMDELKTMREDITKGIMDRYSKDVLVWISILTGLVGIFATGLITVIITHYMD